MAKRKDGGPAFPVAGEYVDNIDQGFVHRSKLGDKSSSGMSLRDWFAGQAIMGVAVTDQVTRDSEADNAARWAYIIADKMLAARSLKNGA